jgi:(1->4)-alpha-D-glucan 1-alpha-D-glucosylmutase
MMPEPRATYRVQLQPAFDLAAAAGLVPQLAEIGFSHLYVSPIAQAVPGSTHGYDVVAPGRVSDQLGGDAALHELHTALVEAGLGLLVDIVPNHRAAHPTDREWWSLLAEGRSGRGARFFDVDWEAPGADGRVVLPMLVRPIEYALRDGAVRVADDPERGTVLEVDGLVLPVAPGTGRPGDDPATVLDRQHYRLVAWREGVHLVNYRRFFDIASLPAVRVEDDLVFEAQHELVARLLREGVADGVRVDHVDGLRDPVGYLEQLRALGAGWLLVEKILGPDETLPGAFDADGTTGYELADRVVGILVDPVGEAPLTELWTSISGDRRGFDELVAEARAVVVEQLFAADLDRVARAFVAAIDHDNGVRAALAGVLAAFDVYRTYVGAGDPARESDRARIDAAVSRAARAGGSARVLGEVRDVLVGARTGPAADGARLRFQQLAAAVAAKGVEDTALFRYARLMARNEVGADPGRFVWTLDAFHAVNADACERWPLGLTALSTHDTKQSGDVRARLAVLSEVPGEWRSFVERRSAGFAGAWADSQRDRVVEYVLLQAAVGAWPVSADRLRAYLRKAARESKRRTSWRDPDPVYEEAVDRLVSSLLDDAEALADVETFVARLLVPGRVGSLAQVVLQLAAPGVPDVYQGDELWNLRLVDPDNRVPMDPSRCAALLHELRSRTAPPAAVLDDPDDPGRPKLWTIVRALDVRRRRPECFAPGARYEPIGAGGAGAPHVLAFGRGGAVVAVAPRLTVSLDGWGDTGLVLPDGVWSDAMSGVEHRGGHVPVEALLASFPVALLERVA